MAFAVGFFIMVTGVVGAFGWSGVLRRRCTPILKDCGEKEICKQISIANRIGSLPQWCNADRRDASLARNACVASCRRDLVRRPIDSKSPRSGRYCPDNAPDMCANTPHLLYENVFADNRASHIRIASSDRRCRPWLWPQ